MNDTIYINIVYDNNEDTFQEKIERLFILWLNIAKKGEQQ